MLALGTNNSTFSGRSQSDCSARGKAATLNSRLGDSWIWVDEEPRGTWKWTLDMFEVPLKGLCWGCQRWGEGCRWCWGGDRKDIRKQHILTKGLIVAASVNQLLEEKNQLSFLSTRIYFWLAWLSPKVSSSHLLLLGKFEYTGGPIFKVVLEC